MMATDIEPRETTAEHAPAAAGDPPALSGWGLLLRIALFLVILPAAIALLAQYVLP